MFKKKQLNVNINDLDLQISRLTKELEVTKRDSKYEATMEKLKALAELKTTLGKTDDKVNDQPSDAVIELDKQIEELTKIIHNLSRDEEYSDKLAKLEALTKVRTQLAESRTLASVKPVVVSGLLSIASVAIVLKYEETGVITSKAFDMAKGMFRGGK
jgi:hypothetical protein